MNSHPPIDFRSDTVTQPGPAMREAMATAAVGDDVYGEDPTVNALQARVGELLGVEASLFVPSGTMANQIAIALHTRPGDEILVGRNAHTWLYETGGAAALSGVQPLQIANDGFFDGDAIRQHCKSDRYTMPTTSLVSVENTHNVAGGRVWPWDKLTSVLTTCRERGLKSHLDGARLWNAAVASGKSEAQLAAGFDTISVCLSKGLGAPVGSLLCGTAVAMRDARRLRKMFGGGMRQAGILAAAGLYAVDHHRQDIATDHVNTKYLAEQLVDKVGLTIAVDQVDTNIIIAKLDTTVHDQHDAHSWCERARSVGVLAAALGTERIRFVVHRDTDSDACDDAVKRLQRL